LADAPAAGLPVAVDAMGGDHAPDAVVRGALLAAKAGVRVLLVGDEARIRPLLPKGSGVEVVHTDDAVAMDEAPVAAVRRRSEASIRVAARLVAEGRARCCVGAGNTGAVMAAALFELGRIEGVERPAVAMMLPRGDGGQLAVLDLGANVDCRPEHLVGFALMGAAFSAVAAGVARPRVGLLSNGAEVGKGNEQVRDAEPLLRALPLHFVGPIEPTEALRGGCDVLVCDGFVGNVMLKTVEGTAEVVGRLLREEVLRRGSDRLGAWLLQGALRRFRQRTDWAAIGGALLLGVPGVVVVAHGRSDPGAVRSAILYAERCARAELVGAVGRQLVAASAPSA
jgi:phosphate acyltransferase